MNTPRSAVTSLWSRTASRELHFDRREIVDHGSVRRWFHSCCPHHPAVNRTLGVEVQFDNRQLVAGTIPRRITVEEEGTIGNQQQSASAGFWLLVRIANFDRPILQRDGTDRR